MSSEATTSIDRGGRATQDGAPGGHVRQAARRNEDQLHTKALAVSLRFLALLLPASLGAADLAAQSAAFASRPPPPAIFPAAAASDRSEELPSPPDRATARSLLAGRPRALTYQVTRSEDGKWIRLSAETEAAYPVHASTIEGIIKNYVGASKVFSRIDWVKIIEKLDNGAITEQFSGVKAFGFKFYTTNRFHMWTSGKGDYTVMHFLQVASGGTLRDCSGYWAVVDRSTADAPLCYLHYSLSFEARDQFPGQEAVMRSFGEADVLRALNELGNAAEKAEKQ